MAKRGRPRKIAEEIQPMTVNTPSIDVPKPSEIEQFVTGWVQVHVDKLIKGDGYTVTAVGHDRATGDLKAVQIKTDMTDNYVIEQLLNEAWLNA